MWQIPHQRAAMETREEEQRVVKTHRERSTSDKVLPARLTSNACSSACRWTPNDPSCCSSLCPSCRTVTVCRWRKTKAERRTAEICQKTTAVVLKKQPTMCNKTSAYSVLLSTGKRICVCNKCGTYTAHLSICLLLTDGEIFLFTLFK